MGWPQYHGGGGGDDDGVTALFFDRFQVLKTKIRNTSSFIIVDYKVVEKFD